MAKNNFYINIRRDFEKIKESVIPSIYATIAVVLYEDGVPEDSIADICARSQELWDKGSGNPLEMLDDAYKKTGLSFYTSKQYEEAKKRGLVE